MWKLFDKTFFQMTLRFLVIVIAGFVVLLIAGSLAANKEEADPVSPYVAIPQ